MYGPVRTERHSAPWPRAAPIAYASYGMKYGVVILGGAGDAPTRDLGGRTPLEAADKPNTDRLARGGRIGRVVTTPEGLTVGSDVCAAALLGYDPREARTGRGPLEAIGRGVDVGPEDWAFRLSFVTVGDEGDTAGLMLDHSGGGLSTDEARIMLADIGRAWTAQAPDLAGAMQATPGAEYRALLVDRSGGSYAALETTAPHDIPLRPWRRHAPAGEGADRLMRLMDIARETLATHPLNEARKRVGLRPANMLWIWGHGRRPRLEPFEERFGVRGGVVAGLDLVTGLGRCVGWEAIHAHGATGDHRTGYRAKGRAAAEALDRLDLVCVHVAATDEMSHRGEPAAKVEAIEAVDREIVGPVLAKLESFGRGDEVGQSGGWRMLIAADHCTSCETRAHLDDPPPFAMGGAWVRSVVQSPLTERAACESDLLVDPGHDLMEYFLFGGLKGPRPGRPRTRNAGND